MFYNVLISHLRNFSWSIWLRKIDGECVFCIRVLQQYQKHKCHFSEFDIFSFALLCFHFTSFSTFSQRKHGGGAEVA